MHNLTLTIDNSVQHGAWIISAHTESDDSSDAPWERECGHGPVSDWRNASMRHGHPSKRSGEMVLCDDHGKARLYDYAEACRIARRDGWGTLHPYDKLETNQMTDGMWCARASGYRAPAIATYDTDRNAAIDALYAVHRATFPSARAYAAAAAMTDYQRLADWCNGRWWYVGVIVTVTHAVTGIQLGQASCWGIESDAGDYLLETANTLIDEAIDDARATVAALTE